MYSVQPDTSTVLSNTNRYGKINHDLLKVFMTCLCKAMNIINLTLVRKIVCLLKLTKIHVV